MDAVAAIHAEIDRIAPAGPQDGPLGVAVSGGSDSIALLVIAQDWACARGRRISAATVDHGLRAESSAEATQVAALCANLGIPHQVLEARDLRDTPGNLSAAARETRFALLSRWARASGLPAVMLGHTMDDQAETVLMRLARGSGVEGLSAMQPRLIHWDMLWLRPMLGIRRQVLRDYLIRHEIDWIEDPTNADSAYERVKARAALETLAPLGIDVEGLAETALRLQRQRRVLERAMEILAMRAREVGGFGEIRLGLDALLSDEEDTALRLVADCLQRVSGAMYRPRFRALSRLFENIKSRGTTGYSLSGCLIRSDGDTVLVCREPGACAPPCPVSAEAATWDRRWRITGSGPWPAGARLGALAEPGLSALRRAAADGTWKPTESWNSAPRLVRETTPAVWLGDDQDLGELLAVPLARYTDEVKLGQKYTVSARNIALEELL